MTIISLEPGLSNSELWKLIDRFEQARKEAEHLGDYKARSEALANENSVLRQIMGAATPKILDLPEAVDEYHGLLSISRTG